jgi:hypothetical protein
VQDQVLTTRYSSRFLGKNYNLPRIYIFLRGHRCARARQFRTVERQERQNQILRVKGLAVQDRRSPAVVSGDTGLLESTDTGSYAEARDALQRGKKFAPDKRSGALFLAGMHYTVTKNREQVMRVAKCTVPFPFNRLTNAYFGVHPKVLHP